MARAAALLCSSIHAPHASKRARVGRQGFSKSTRDIYRWGLRTCQEPRRHLIRPPLEVASCGPSHLIWSRYVYVLFRFSASHWSFHILFSWHAQLYGTRAQDRRALHLYPLYTCTRQMARAPSTNELTKYKYRSSQNCHKVTDRHKVSAEFAKKNCHRIQNRNITNSNVNEHLNIQICYRQTCLICACDFRRIGLYFWCPPVRHGGQMAVTSRNGADLGYGMEDEGNRWEKPVTLVEGGGQG